MRGKRTRKRNKKKPILPIILIILIVIIVVFFIVWIIFKNINSEGNEISKYNSTNTDHDPKVTYYDEENGERKEIEENQVFNKKIVACYDKGKAIISKDGEEFKDYELEKLEQGKYTLVVLGEDKTITKRSFEVDIVPPKIIGVKEEIYDTDVKIELEDPADAKIATLTKRNGEVINLKETLLEKGDIYNLTENGSYNIYLEDYHENSINIKFFIRK